MKNSLLELQLQLNSVVCGEAVDVRGIFAILLLCADVRAWVWVMLLTDSAEIVHNYSLG